MTILLAVVGMAGSGKSTVVRVLQDVYQSPTVYFGGIVLDELRARGLPSTQESEAIVREDLRREHGMGAMAILAAPALGGMLARESTLVLIDGLYSGAELFELKGRFQQDLVTLAVHAKRSVRESRMASRGTRSLSPEELLARDIREIERIDKATPIALADLHVLNDGTEGELAEAAVAAVNSVLSGS